MGALVALFATGCSWSDLPRFGWPRGITLQAHRMLHLWMAACIAALAVGVIVWGLIFWTVTFHRKKSEEIPRQTKYHHGLEVIYTGIPLIAVIVLFYFTAVTQNYVNDDSKKPDITVTAVAFQWNWEFDYDGVSAQTPQQVASTVGNSSTIPVLVLPTHKVVRIEEHSDDVIHSFWVPEMLFKRDVIPGVNNSFQFTITREGAFVGRCAELCGTYHSMMNFELRAVSPADYEKYVKTLAGLGNAPDRQAKALASIGLPPRAVTTKPFPTDRTVRRPA
ncbi:MAG: aa3-type cytochrome oxidase subunit II [Mycobacteriales bacterium]